MKGLKGGKFGTGKSGGIGPGASMMDVGDEANELPLNQSILISERRTDISNSRFLWHKQSWREYGSEMVHDSPFGMGLDLIQGVVSIAACGLYVWRYLSQLLRWMSN
jgi:hypothetical protein